MASKKIKFPHDFANRPDSERHRGMARYVLVKEPLEAHITVQRADGNTDAVFVSVWIGKGAVGEGWGGYGAITHQEDLLPIMNKAREDILEYMRKEVVKWKATLNAAKV
jgi:hypothetical protein